MSGAVGKGELKAWAREKLRGVENLIIPSFSPDLSELDEEGIRWDVRQSIKHGFFSTMCAAELGLTLDEAKRFVEIVAAEAGEKILVSTTLFFDSFAENMELARHAQKVGLHCGLLGYPANFNPASEEEIYNATKMVCDAAELGIVLYAAHRANFERFHPSGFPLEQLPRLAEIDNVVALKVGSNDSFFVAECFERCGEKILVNAAMPDLLSFTVPRYGQQWIGASVYEMFQSPEQPYFVNYFNLLQEGKFGEAAEVYWKMKPLLGLFEQHIMAIVMGAYPWTMFKYYQWCVGGNGGYTRKPQLKIFHYQMMAAKMAYFAAGIIPREPDDEFYLGRVNYARAQGKEA